jgi:hypothetical protein
MVEGVLAQLVEQLTLNHQVPGSNPACPIIFLKDVTICGIFFILAIQAELCGIIFLVEVKGSLI